MKLIDARLGREIRDARQRHGLTQHDLAERCAMSRRRLIEIERGANFSVGVLAAIVAQLPELAAVIGECLTINDPARRGA